MNTKVNDLEQWIDALIAERFGTAQRLAHAIEMSHSAFSRGVRGGTLGVEALLRLARVTGDDPGAVLRLAGKARVADLLDELYGHAPKNRLPSDVQEIADGVMRLNTELRAVTVAWIRAWEASATGALPRLPAPSKSDTPGATRGRGRSRIAATPRT